MKIRRRLHSIQCHTIRLAELCWRRLRVWPAWQVYKGWRWRKSANRLLAGFSIITLSLVTYSAFAATSTTTMVPDGDVTMGWSPTPAGSHFSTVDDGTTDVTSDLVQVFAANSTTGVTDQFTLSNPSAVASASQLVVRIYMKSITASNGSIMDTISLNLIINGTAQTATTCTPSYNTWTACTATYSGSWTSADVNSMQVSIVRNILGSGKPADQPDGIQVSNVYGTLTYVPAIQYTQSAYRWFGNQDTSNKLTFANSYSGGYDNSIVQTADGGYATAGCTGCGSMGSNLLLTKYDSSGNVSWSRQWNGYSMAEAGTLVQTKDGGYAIAGDTYNPGGGGYYMYLIKFDSSGNIVWRNIWGGSTYNDVAVAVAESSDGSLAVTGYTASYGAAPGTTFDAFLTKFTSSGTMLWSKAFGAAAGDDYGWSVVATSDGGYALAGYGNSYTSAGNDVFLARFDKDGNLLWTRTWGGAYNDYVSSVSLTSDGGYALTGYTASYGTNPGAGFDAFLIKFDSAGDLKWSKTWGSVTGDELAYGVISTSDGGYALTGETASYGGGGRDAFLAKFSSTGSLQWSKTFGGGTDDIGYSLVQTGDGGYAVTGEVNGSNGFIAKFDANGDIAGCGGLCTSPSVTLASPTVTAGQPTANTTTFTDTPGINGSVTIYTVTKTVMVAASPTSIGIGAPLAAQDTPVNAPDEGTIFRLRLNLHVGGA
ncbi:MAG TPA: hypothetical protein VFK03_01720, partial [Candidatus Saccharimonadales bacterium]|nr:hypothetical protein [Candidatus Saccharimonadales bacterium]